MAKVPEGASTQLYICTYLTSKSVNVVYANTDETKPLQKTFGSGRNYWLSKQEKKK